MLDNKQKLEVEMQECCKKCKLPINIQREPVLLSDSFFSILEYDANCCESCGHQKDGSSLPEVHKLIQKIVNDEMQHFKKLQRFYYTFHFLTQDERQEVCVYLPRFCHPNYKEIYQDLKPGEEDIQEPYSWNCAFIEILNNTKLGLIILNQISEDKLDKIKLKGLKNERD